MLKEGTSVVKKLKIATIGGGSSYTPELIEGFIQRKDELPIGEIWLVDIEEGREKLEVVGGLIKRMVAAAGLDWQVHLTLDRRAALKDADFVTTQFRVGLLDARVKDERIPLSHGILGQETNGAGGIFKAFRTIPVILDIVEDIKELCPNAWVINFTNPAGMVTEAVLKYGQFERIVGLCNVPLVHTMTEAKAIGRDPEDVVFLYGGLNHFHWHRVYDRDGKEITEQVMDVLFADGGKDMENIRRLDFQAEQIRDLGVLPCGYHRYYYLAHDMLQAALEDYEKNETRAEVVKRIEAELLDLYRDPDLDVKPDR
ncbi:MAG: 6-phospho-beta-glucosidase, partial [Firmicutes bacterium]|nr:6-phospho-beta-glucosidase [Bacillota bacterium]